MGYFTSVLMIALDRLRLEPCFAFSRIRSACADYDRELNEQQTNDLVSALEEKGMKINSPELAPFAAATEKVLTDNADTYGDLLDQLKAWKEAR